MSTVQIIRLANLCLLMGYQIDSNGLEVRWSVPEIQFTIPKMQQKSLIIHTVLKY